jgi:hypothetical protein
MDRTLEKPAFGRVPKVQGGVGQSPRGQNSQAKGQRSFSLNN